MYPYAVYCVMASNLGVAGHFIRRYRTLIPPHPLPAHYINRHALTD